MERHRRAMYELYLQIESSDHPNAAAIAEDLRENELAPPAWATHVVQTRLESPDDWECLTEGSTDADLGIRHRAATKAVEGRGAGRPRRRRR
jgi:hypothetical protein